MLSVDAAARDVVPLPPYIRIIILLAVVIGGLVLSVTFIVFCSHCLKKIKQLKRSVFIHSFIRSFDDFYSTYSSPLLQKLRGATDSLQHGQKEQL